jgi:hypothetical protein
MVSIKRINHFMNAEELDPSSVSHDPSESIYVFLCTEGSGLNGSIFSCPVSDRERHLQLGR